MGVRYILCHFPAYRTLRAHPGSSSEYSVSANTGRPMDAITNSFCAVSPAIVVLLKCNLMRAQGGNVLGNGTWLNVGGNQAVTYGGITAPDQNVGGPYGDPDGGNSYVCLPRFFKGFWRLIWWGLVQYSVGEILGLTVRTLAKLPSGCSTQVITNQLNGS